MESYVMIDGVKYTLTEMQAALIKADLDLVPPRSLFARAEVDETYYFITPESNVVSALEIGAMFDIKRYSNANYCLDEKVMHQRALHESLDRQLYRFAMENGGIGDWYIYYSEELGYDFIDDEENVNSYFINSTVAAQAISNIILPFVKKYPEFRWRYTK